MDWAHHRLAPGAKEKAADKYVNSLEGIPTLMHMYTILSEHSRLCPGGKEDTLLYMSEFVKALTDALPPPCGRMLNFN